MVQNGGSLRCQKCFKRCSYLKGTFFEQLKLPISKILELGYYWLNNIRVSSLRNMGEFQTKLLAAILKNSKILFQQ